jgi:drug/metabolite transporter (DMT)-like permease
LWVGLQFVIAGFLTVGSYSVFCKKIVVPKKKSIKSVVTVSALQTVIQYALVYIGLLNTTSVKGAILKSTDVFFVALLASYVFKLEKMTAKKLFACIIGFLGIIVMNLNGLSLSFSPLGDGFVLLGILSYSLGVILIKRFAQNEDPIVLSGYQMLLGGAVLLLVGLIFKGKMDIVGMLPVVAGLSAIYALTYTLWTLLLKYNSPSSITIYSFMTPVFGVLFSALLLNEEGGMALPNLVLALVLVCAGILLWGYEKKSVQSAT